MAGALFLAVPIMLVQLFMQRYLVYGLTAGAEKG
jgi:arabinogalactan oligomer/maltooligosaccharide transport system permease protein